MDSIDHRLSSSWPTNNMRIIFITSSTNVLDISNVFQDFIFNITLKSLDMTATDSIFS